MPDYPPLPWRLRGRMHLAFALVPLEAARRWIPDDLSVVPFTARSTVAALALGRYHRGSTLVYSELIVAVGLARCGSRPGFWVSHIYVDDLDSLEAGREMFGLPKELAAFEWDEQLDGSGGVTVTRDGETLLTGRWSGPWPIALPLPLYAPVLGSVNGDRRAFNALGKAQVGAGRLRLQIPMESPFSGLGLERPALTLRADHLDLRFPEVKVLTT